MSKQFKSEYDFIRKYMSYYGHRIQPTDADDIFQNAVLRALKNGDNHKSPNFFGYLSYSCLGIFRELKKRRYEPLSDNQAAEEIILTPEDMERLDNALGNLPQSQKDAVTAALKGMTTAQIAVVTGTNTNVAAINRCRGVKTLRDLLN